MLKAFLGICILSSKTLVLAKDTFRLEIESDDATSDPTDFDLYHGVSQVVLHNDGIYVQQSTFRPRNRASLPVENPTKSFWLDTPGANPLADEGSTGPLSKKADVCIIGSGMTGSSAAWHISNIFKEESLKTSDPLSVVVLEARKFCSGATGRNGGHLTQNVASSFLSRQAKHNTTEAVKTYLVEEYTAKKLVQFITERDLEGTVDLVEGGHITLFHTLQEENSIRNDWQAAKDAGYGASVRWIGNKELQEKYGLNRNLNYTGVFFNSHNFWPCKVVTQLYQEAASASPNVNVRLHTHTPVTGFNQESELTLQGPSTKEENRWTLHTPRGNMSCKYVIHATNGYASHLLPFLAGIEAPIHGTLDSIPRGAHGIIPTRGQIGTVRSTVRPNELGWLSSWDDNDGDEYWFPRFQDTKREDGTSTGKNPLIILGGGRHKAEEDTKETGIADDSIINPVVSRALRAYLPEIFPSKFSAPVNNSRASQTVGNTAEVTSNDVDGDNWEMEWSGIMGFTSDSSPFVGPVASPFKDSDNPTYQEQRQYPGQYIAAGFSGHGMPRAYGCAEIVAGMIAAEIKGEEWTSPAWLPAHYLSWANEP